MAGTALRRCRVAGSTPRCYRMAKTALRCCGVAGSALRSCRVAETGLRWPGRIAGFDIRSALTILKAFVGRPKHIIQIPVHC